MRSLALVPLLFAACVDSGDEGIFVLTNNAVTGDTCALTGSPDQAQQGHGQINVISPSAYVMTPLVQSRIMPSSNFDDIARTVQLRGADVVLTLKAATVNLNTKQVNKTYPGFSVLFSGAVAPGASVNAFVDIIPPSSLRQVVSDSGASLTDSVQAEVLAQVIIKGDLNGDSIESQPFFYPVSVCTDCVINNVGACTTFTGNARSGNACNPFQDGVLDCCTDASNNLVCPARAMM